LTPVAIRESKGNIIAQSIIFEQQFQSCGVYWAINEVGTSIAENMVGTLGNYRIEIPKLFDNFRQLISDNYSYLPATVNPSSAVPIDFNFSTTFERADLSIIFSISCEMN